MRISDWSSDVCSSDLRAGVIESESLDFVQLPYSIALRDAEKRLLPLAAERGVAVVVNRPFEGGAMFPKTRGKPLPAWANEFDCKRWGQFFLQIIPAPPDVHCVLPGTSKPKRSEEPRVRTELFRTSKT